MPFKIFKRVGPMSSLEQIETRRRNLTPHFKQFGNQLLD